MEDPSLHDYLAVLRRRRRVVVSSVLLAVLVALVISLVQSPRYRADADLLLRRTTSEELLVDELGQVSTSADAQRELNNEIRVIESRAVRDAVDDVYDGPLEVDDVVARATAAESDDGITISVESTEADAAADLVNVYAETYLEVRRTRQVDDIVAAGEEIQTRLDEVRSQIAEVARPLDDINAQIAAAPAGSDQRANLEEQRQSVVAEVLPQLSPLQSRESTFVGQLQQLEVTEDLTRSGGVEILAPADAPDAPVSPDTVSNVIVGALIGLLGGIALAFAFDRLDDSVRTKETAESITGLPTLGVIPKGGDGVEMPDLVALEDPLSPGSEAYRLLRTSVKFLGIDAPLTTIVVTSAAASEGKTVTAANLAVTLAQTHERVLLVCADLRRPRVHELFGAPTSPGLTTVLLGDTPPEDAVYAIEEAPGLHLLPPGIPPPNPAELLDSTRADEVFAGFAERYDAVIVDTPPVLPVTDTVVLAQRADAVLMVVAYRETSRRGLARAVEMLEQVEAPLVGTVLNLVPAKEGYGGQAYRYDTYRSRSERRRARQAHGVQPTPHPRTATATPSGGAQHLAGNGSGRPASTEHDPPPISGEEASGDLAGEPTRDERPRLPARPDER
jgi:polysaccharide biosynthesis transport protein